MYEVINGRRYDTKKATRLGGYSYGERGDFRRMEESLYKTKKGALFLAGSGGPLTYYAKEVASGQWSEGEMIQPMSAEEAVRWCEANHLSEVIVEHFPGHVELA